MPAKGKLKQNTTTVIGTAMSIHMFIQRRIVIQPIPCLVRGGFIEARQQFPKLGSNAAPPQLLLPDVKQCRSVAGVPNE